MVDRRTMSTPKNVETIEHFLRELEHPAKRLTVWELEFMTDVKDQFDRTGFLSQGQFEKLEQIYAEKTA
jgi:hypothetical protein